jgi:Tfp pilus assembly protein PilF
MRSVRFKRSLVALYLAANMVGCGPGQIAAPDIAQQTQRLDQAIARLAAKDYVGAKENAQAALTGAGLSSDQAIEASMILIESAIETGDLDIADAKLKEVESVSPDMGRVCVLRGRYWRKSGSESKAQTAFQDALRHDPNVIIPN